MSLYSRLKTWISNEKLTYSDLNAEFDNILANSVSNKQLSGLDYSTGLRAPDGPINATASISDEVQWIRSMIKSIVGGDFWYSSPANNLTTLTSLITQGSPLPTRVELGAVDANKQPMFLLPYSARRARVVGTSTNLAYTVSGTSHTITSDIISGTLSAAPGSGNICVAGLDVSFTTTNASAYILLANILTSTLEGIRIGDIVSGTGIPGGATVLEINTPFIKLSAAATTSATNVLTFSSPIKAGDTEILVKSMGGSISALVGTTQTFSLAGTYLSAFIKSTTKLTECKQGIFFDVNGNSIPSGGGTSGSTLTLMKTAWVFLDNTGALKITYTNPYITGNFPASATAGEFLFDLNSNDWYTYTTYWTLANAVLLGVVVMDTTDCVASRSVDFFNTFSLTNSVSVSKLDSTTIRGVGEVSVYGRLQRGVPAGAIKWAAPTDVDGGGSLTVSTLYYLYLSAWGKSLISPIAPIDRRDDLFGYYHPSLPYRCLGLFTTDGSSNAQEPVSILEGSLNLAQTLKAPNNIPKNFMHVAGKGTGTFTATTPTSVGYLGTLTTRGNPVVIKLLPQDMSDPNFLTITTGFIEVPCSNVTVPIFNFLLYRDGVCITRTALSVLMAASGYVWFPTVLEFMDFAPAGTHTYEIKVASSYGDACRIGGAKMVGYELVLGA